jgi:hypothetical protein
MPPKESLLDSFFRFVFRPVYTSAPAASFSRKTIFWNLFRLFSLAAVVSLFLAVAISLYLDKLGHMPEEHAIVDLIFQRRIWFLVFMGCVWAPVTEELTFRAGLRYGPWVLGFSLLFLGLTVFDIFDTLLFPESEVEVGPEPMDISSQQWILALGSVVAFFFFGWILGLLFRKFLPSKKVHQWYQKYFPWLFYTSTLLFASLHLFNYLNLEKIWMLAPLLVSPQFFIGLVLGYVRMRYGLWWAMGYHAFHNSMFMIPVLFALQLFAAPEIQNALRQNDSMAVEAYFQMHPTMGLWVLLLLFFLFLFFGLILFALGHLVWELHRVKQNQSPRELRSE